MAEWNDDNEHEFVVRHHNRVLRKVNKALRNSHQLTKEYNDALFRELCNAGTEAELAIDRLFLSGLFNCDKNDYNFIVDTCIEALNDRKNSLQ